jgi:hypothetical protein
MHRSAHESGPHSGLGACAPLILSRKDSDNIAVNIPGVIYSTARLQEQQNGTLHPLHGSDLLVSSS